MTRAALACTKVDFRIPGADAADQHHGDHAHGMHVHELVELVQNAPISDDARRRAVRAFELVGEAEGKVHGVEPARVHLHEVGAIDAALDVVGALEGFEQLGVEAVYHRPVAIGRGWVDAAHGALPVPAPATALLLEGLDIAADGPAVGEATTPTGAALLRVRSDGPPPAHWRIVASGWGAGTRNPDGYANALRLLVADTAAEAGEMVVLSTDIDDLQPEYLETLRQAVFDAGAVDCVAWPTGGKKGRVSLRVEAQVPGARADDVAEAVFRHSTTAGIRRQIVTRITLPRRQLEVELTPEIRVRIKVWDAPDGPRLKAEYDDVVAAAARLGQPALRVARDAERRAEAMLTNGRTTDTSAGES